MNLILINQFYPPDGAPTGRILSVVAEELAEQGHEVTVLCTRGENYAEGGSGDEVPPERENLWVVRLGSGGKGGRMMNYLGFYLRVGWYLIRHGKRADRVLALTTPPYLSILARFCSRCCGADHAHWVMDIYPDVLMAHGMIREDGLLAAILRRLASWGWGGSRCHEVIGLGPDMAQRLDRYLKKGRSSAWVPLWATAPDCVEESRIQQWRQKSGWQEDTLVLLYSGNMGLGHSFSEFLEAAKRRPENVTFAFTGRGKRREEIAKFLSANPDTSATLGEYIPSADLATHLAAADVHLASLLPSWSGTMIPSKIQGSFQAGRPTIFVGPEDSSPFRWIRESSGGWAIVPEDVDGLMQAIEEAGSPEERRQRGQAARAYAEEHFNPLRNARAVAELISG